MILTPEERYAVVIALVDLSARHRETHGGNLLERLPGDKFMLTPKEMEDLAQRFEDEGEPPDPNTGLLG